LNRFAGTIDSVAPSDWRTSSIEPVAGAVEFVLSFIPKYYFLVIKKLVMKKTTYERIYK